MSLSTYETPKDIIALTREALKAFRHNPTDGSFALPAARPNT